MGPALLLERGWAGFPCYPGTKKPAWPRGLHAATRDPDRLAGWWARHPSDNVAVNCEQSALVVIDLDVKHGVDGIRHFFGLCQQHGQPWPATFSAVTPSGGTHLYFAGSTRTSISRLASGIDIKSRGGYVLCPPSAINQQPYRAGVIRTVAPFPDWLAQLNQPTVCQASLPSPPQPVTERSQRWATAALDAETAKVARAGEGSRNHTLYRAALKLGSVAWLLDADRIFAALTAAATSCGLDPDEIGPTIDSGYRTGIANPRRPR